jgi:hypothetical protein
MRWPRIFLLSAVTVALLSVAVEAQRSGHFVVDVLSQTEPPVHRLDRDYFLTVRRFEDRNGEPFWEVALRRTSDTTYDNLLYHSTEWHGPYPVHVGAITISQHLFPSTRVLPGYRGAPYVVIIRLHDDIRIADSDTNAVFRGGSFEVSWRPKRRRASPPQTRRS